MGLQMTFHAALTFETLLTLKTLVRFLYSVNSHVSLEVSFKSETLFTLFAGERFLSRCEHSILKVWIVYEIISTVMAQKKAFLRCEFLILKVTCVCETFVLMTFKMFLSWVNPRVLCKVFFTCDTLSTLITCEQILSSVNPHVTQFPSCEALLTLSAG